MVVKEGAEPENFFWVALGGRAEYEKVSDDDESNLLHVHVYTCASNLIDIHVYTCKCTSELYTNKSEEISFYKKCLVVHSTELHTCMCTCTCLHTFMCSCI